MRFVLLTIGKAKFPFVEEGVQHYVKNIGHKAEIEVEVLRDCGSDLSEEGEQFIKYLERKKYLDDGRTRIVCLDEGGKSYGSMEFSHWIAKLETDGVSRLVFLIGGAFGFAEPLRKFPKISLSKMTFPHDLARVIILEQIYRALHIQAGSKYHHP